MSFVSNIESHVVLSPHPDDAVLSLGACMAAWRRMDHAVSVLTIFDGPPTGVLTPAALEDRARYSVDPVPLRMAEDRRAVAFFDADYASAGFEELVYRYRLNGEPRLQSLEDLYGPLDSDDESVVAAVADLLLARSFDGTTVHVPRAVGGHSDHRVVRVAAERVLERFEFYDDMPYAVRENQPGPTAAWPQLVSADVDAWITGIKMYDSQMSNLFEAMPDWEDRFRAFAPATQ